MQIPQALILALQGMISGILLAILGYGKQVNEKGELPQFNSAKFASTVIIGAIVGLIMANYNVDYGTAMNMFAQTGLITVIEYAVKTVYRWLKAMGYDVIPESLRTKKKSQ
jgi:peptidoglycan biosynthesis protein MviN/MurJ (putative lipid II flippase)